MPQVKKALPDKPYTKIKVATGTVKPALKQPAQVKPKVEKRAVKKALPK